MQLRLSKAGEKSAWEHGGTIIVMARVYDYYARGNKEEVYLTAAQSFLLLRMLKIPNHAMWQY